VRDKSENKKRKNTKELYTLEGFLKKKYPNQKGSEKGRW